MVVLFVQGAGEGADDLSGVARDSAEVAGAAG